MECFGVRAASGIPRDAALLARGRKAVPRPAVTVLVTALQNGVLWSAVANGIPCDTAFLK